MSGDLHTIGLAIYTQSSSASQWILSKDHCNPHPIFACRSCHRETSGFSKVGLNGDLGIVYFEVWGVCGLVEAGDYADATQEIGDQSRRNF